jgi:hypothetical protein
MTPGSTRELQLLAGVWGECGRVVVWHLVTE